MVAALAEAGRGARARRYLAAAVACASSCCASCATRDGRLLRT